MISPLLANVYLHEVLDSWYEREVQPRLRGRSFLIRYADDAVLVFETRADAERVLAVLAERMNKYGLRLHPEKTQLVGFERPSGDDPKGGPGSFDLLGFTHYWGRSRRGRWIVKRKTARDRLRRALRRVWLWCREHRHWPIGLQHRLLRRQLLGHYSYYGITGNADALVDFRSGVLRGWRRWLDRRGGKRRMTWERFFELLSRYPVPRPRVVQSIYRRAKP